MIEGLTTLGRSAIGFVVFILVLGLLVVVHELGHFVVARLARVRVLEFGVGFPPRAKILRSEGETLVTLNWLPIGGFARLEGEDDESDDPRSFLRAGLPTKLLILGAGVVMNALLAIAILAGIAWLPGPIVALGFTSVQPDSPAARAGLHAAVSRDGEPPSGDLIVAVDGLRFHDSEGGSELIAALRARAGRLVELTVVRADGTSEDVPVPLRSPQELDSTHGPLGIVGTFASTTGGSFTRSPLEALGRGVVQTGDAIALIQAGLGQLGDAIVHRPTEAPPVEGPVGIAVGVGNAFWEGGLIPTLQLAARLSASLALVNLLPLPPLDGGRMLVSVIKSVAGRRASLRVERLTYLVGFGFLMAFLVWVTFFDIARQAGGGQ